jgi:Spy/CpxP family protein refolding chaperone
MQPWIKRSLFALMGVGITLGVTACGHGPMGGGDPMGGAGTMMGMHGGGHHRGPMSDADVAKRQERMLERATKELSLDDAQKQRLATLMSKMHAQRKAMMGEPGKGPREDMQALIAGDRFDRSKAQALVDAKTGALKAASPELIAAAGDFFDSLKPEQQAKVREFMARRGGRHHGMMGGSRG